MSDRARMTPAWWYGDRRPPFGARIVASVYGRVVAARRSLYRSGLMHSAGVGVPVLVIGNLVAGGSGKTPLAIAVVQRLVAEGWVPGVATRGFGRADGQRALWVEHDTSADVAGDEPLLIARHTTAKVRVDRDRAAAAETLVEAGCNVVVCDDGLQHYRLRRDIEIEVIDGRRRYGNGLLLPAGPLRESATRGADCDFRVVNLPRDVGGGAEAGFGEWPMRLAADRAQPLLGGRAHPLSSLIGQRVHAVAGIGDPERFFAMLRGIGLAIVPHAFPDHHRYVASDFTFGSDLPVLMTEKDAVKCLDFATPRHFSVPVRAELPEAFWVALLDRLRQSAGVPG